MARQSEYVPVTRRHVEGLRKLLKLFEDQLTIAETLGISKQTVNGWFTGRLVIPIVHADRLVNMSQGRIKMTDLRPDREKIYKKDLQD